jgi:hypothetical protein
MITSRDAKDAGKIKDDREYQSLALKLGGHHAVEGDKRREDEKGRLGPIDAFPPIPEGNRLVKERRYRCLDAGGFSHL